MRDGEVQIEQVWKRFRRFEALERPSAMQRILSGAHRGEWWWVLRDINVQLEPGDALGIMGRNGSGKSTLVKLIAGHIYPYAGQVRVGGHTAALIEMTAGTNGELSGRENIYLIGSLIGRTRKEIAASFDDIVSFAGVRDAIDRPYRFYSSGMKARLAFAATTAWAPDVLVIDEVLSVGDAEFGERAEQRIRGLCAQGVTLLLVSHDLTTLRSLCDRSMFLQDGVVRSFGRTEEVISDYEGTLEVSLRMHVEGILDILGITGAGRSVDQRAEGAPSHTLVELGVDLELREAQRLHVSLGIARAGHLTLRSQQHVDVPRGESTTTCSFDPQDIFGGTYWIWIGIDDADGRTIVPWQRAVSVTIDAEPAGAEPGPPPRPIPIRTRSAWRVEALRTQTLPDASVATSARASVQSSE